MASALSIILQKADRGYRCPPGVECSPRRLLPSTHRALVISFTSAKSSHRPPASTMESLVTGQVQGRAGKSERQQRANIMYQLPKSMTSCCLSAIYVFRSRCNPGQIPENPCSTMYIARRWTRSPILFFLLSPSAQVERGQTVPGERSKPSDHAITRSQGWQVALCLGLNSTFIRWRWGESHLPPPSQGGSRQMTCPETAC